MPLRKPANLPHPRLPAPTGPNFKGLSPNFLLYKNGSNLTQRQLNTISINTQRPHKIHFKVIGLQSILNSIFEFQTWIPKLLICTYVEFAGLSGYIGLKNVIFYIILSMSTYHHLHFEASFDFLFIVSNHYSLLLTSILTHSSEIQWFMLDEMTL